MTTIEQTPEAVSTPAKPRRRWRAWGVFLLLLGAIYVLAQEYMQQQHQKELQAIQTSETRPSDTVQADTKPETHVESAALHSITPTDATPLSQDARIQALEEKLAALSQHPADSASLEQSKLALTQANQTMALLKGQMELLQQQLQAVKTQTQQQGLPVRQLQLWVVLAQLKIAIERGTASMPLVAQLREGWVDSEPKELDALRQLAEAAEYRIPTDASLLQDFHQLRGDVTASLLQKDVGFWYRIKAALREHIRIRRLDKEATPATNPSDDALQTLDETEAMLANGEIKAAIEAVNSLPNGRTAFESWLANAQRLVNARNAVDLLEKSLLESMQSTPLRESAFPAADDTSEDAAEDAAAPAATANPSSSTVE